MTALDAVLRRQSHSKVTEEAPTRLQLLPFVEAAATVADHSGLKPWRLIELRGDARHRLGAAEVTLECDCRRRTASRAVTYASLKPSDSEFMQ